jgi:hypothetical protein
MGGDRLIDKFYDALIPLVDSLHMYTSVKDPVLGSRGFHSVAVGNSIVFHKVTGAAVHFHSSFTDSVPASAGIPRFAVSGMAARCPPRHFSFSLWPL